MPSGKAKPLPHRSPALFLRAPSMLLPILAATSLALGTRAPQRLDSAPERPDPRGPAWALWWQANEDELLELRGHVRRGADDPNLCFTRGKEPGSLAPTREQITLGVAPALLEALQAHASDDVLCVALIALARTGVEEVNDTPLVPLFARHLQDSSGEVRKSAALALGILGTQEAVPILEGALHWAGTTRERACAAAALGLLGARGASTDLRSRIAAELQRALTGAPPSAQDLRVACALALGLVPCESHAGEAAFETLALLVLDADEDVALRGVAAGALARASSADEPRRPRGARAATTLRRALEEGHVEVVRSAALALGIVQDEGRWRGDTDRALLAATRHGDPVARGFARIALARRTSVPDGRHDRALDQEIEACLRRPLGRPGPDRAWAALACGLRARALPEESADARARLQEALLQALEGLGDAEDPPDMPDLGPLALGCGLAGVDRAVPLLRARLSPERAVPVDGQLALALGLCGAREALAEIQSLTEHAVRRPEVLIRATRARGVLGDKEAVPHLWDLLQEVRGLAPRAALTMALADVGDQRIVEPLVTLLRDRSEPALLRRFAALALGIVADRDPLPWSALLGTGVDPVDAPPILRDPSTGTGLLEQD